MTFCELFFMMYEGTDRQWSVAMTEVKRMKRQHPDLYLAWREYCNRAIRG
jgi:hypothetical protein